MYSIWIRLPNNKIIKHPECNYFTDAVNRLKTIKFYHNELKQLKLIKNDLDYLFMVFNYKQGEWEKWSDMISGIEDPLEFIEHRSKVS